MDASRQIRDGSSTTASSDYGSGSVTARTHIPVGENLNMDVPLKGVGKMFDLISQPYKINASCDSGYKVDVRE